MEKQITGFILLNKPKDVSSFSCVNHIKKLLPRKAKVGHTGTLDNFATGLLIICIGRQATKQVPSLMGLDKTYVVTAKLGELTDTLDCTGEIIETKSASSITKEGLENAIKALGRSYVQVPPIYSALKHQGRPLYELARKQKMTEEELGKIVELKKREVQLHELQLTDFSPPYFSFIARVSKGTYIRSLAHDIATKAGSIATTYELERSAIGHISLDQAITLDALTSQEDIEKHLLDVINPAL